MAGRGHTADKSRIGWDKQAARGGGKGAMEPMTIKRRPRPSPRRRQIAALLVSAGVLWTVAVTAASPTAQAALQALGRQGDVALAILRHQLADGRELDAVPASVALAIGQSPLLLGGREAVGELRGQDETDTDEGADGGEDGQNEAGPPTIPIQEEAADPGTPLIFADNGVPARTLVPTTTEGYVVTGDVYINNRSDKSFDASLFDGTFDASLSEEGPQVLIVHTHGSEAYTMPEGQEYVPSSEYRTTDCEYNTVRVGRELAATLEEAGLSVIHDETLHDYPQYSGAYDRSLETIESYLEQYPTISIVLDVHRDAVADGEGNMVKVVSSVAGVNAAQMTFVVGTDGGGLEHPNWAENLKLAAAVQQDLCEDYPTLMRPITVRNSRYNQHVTTGTLLVEMGAAGNSLDEALLSAQLLGQSLAEVLLAKTAGA